MVNVGPAGAENHSMGERSLRGESTAAQEPKFTGETPDPRRARSTPRVVYALGGLIFALGLAASIVGYLKLGDESEKTTDESFDDEASALAKSVQQEIDGYFNSLTDLGAMVQATYPTTSTEFENYVKSSEIFERQPTLKGAFFVERVPRDELDAFEARMREEYGPTFNVLVIDPETPGGAAVNDHFVISTQFVSEGPLQLPIGLDAAGFDVIQEVINFAATEGIAVAGRFQDDPLLVQAAHSSSVEQLDALEAIDFFPAVPVWSTDVGAVDDPDYSQLLGFVVGLVDDFQEVIPESLVGSDETDSIGLHVVGGVRSSADSAELYEVSHIEGGAGAVDDARFTTSSTFVTEGLEWTVNMWAAPGYGEQDRLGLVVLVGGALLSLLLALVVLVRGRAWARDRAYSRALKESERWARLLIETSNDMITLADAEGRITYASPSLLERFELDTDGDESLTRLIIGIIHPDDRSSLSEWYADIAARSGASGVFSYRVKDPRGPWLHVESSAVNLLEDDTIRSVLMSTRDMTERRRFEAELERLALHDALTGLPNRLLLLDRIRAAVRRAVRNRAKVAVLFLDLDRFKVVNDSLGHSLGDELLRVVADRLSDAVRASDTVARLGGDEFVVLCEDLSSTEDAVSLADDLLEVLNQPVVVDQQEIVTSASIGIAFVDESTDPDSVLRDADIAMYRAKESGGSSSEVFDDLLRVRAAARLEIEQELRRAMESGQLLLRYQPIVSATRGLVAAEALLRWDRPGFGVVGPSHFLDVAEETGLIVAIGDWAIGTAFRQARGWLDAAGADREASPAITINVSMRQLRDPAFVRRVRRHLDESGVPPSKVGFEVTEHAVVEELDHCLPVLHELRDLGVNLAIDDFGTGMSSLSYVKRLPIVQAIKIDRSFIADLEFGGPDHAIVHAVVAMAQRLGITVVAEGVETITQLRALVDLGCELMQGFYFSRPVDGERLTTLDFSNIADDLDAAETPVTAGGT
ncbi:MAG: hypothetical protein JJLCMIEE_00963 [Acidimicrobiales bacterium]|nr:MAG: EAL domain-containing protein [Actinomycetota bacterium]MBV6507905.1 hypothetical protein [Acidimicrobiales bacterium]RIK06885.1 MAG: hypothetical protein DCC48_05190 [Acidobacteriota bacterium]